MKIVIMRHGDALSARDDKSRELSPKGIKEINYLGEMIKRFDFNPTKVITSDLVRAKQTGDILRKKLMIDDTPINDRALAPGCRLDDIMLYTDTFDDEDLIFVGHMPDVAEHVSRLTSFTGMQVDFDPGTAVGIRFNGSKGIAQGKVSFVVPPLK